MENQKHKKGKKITSLQAFEKSDCVWFQVKYGGDDFKLFHRGALENLTVKTLQNWIYSGRLFETIKAKQEPFLVVDEFLMKKEEVIAYIEKFGLDKKGLAEKDRKVLEVSVKMLKQKENKNGNQYK